MKKRYVLYSFDRDALADSHLYVDRAAADDAVADLNNVIAIPLVIPADAEDAELVVGDGEGEWWHEDDD